MKKKILTLLVLLMTAVTGAWAQEQSETIATMDDNIVEGTHFTISNNNCIADEVGMSADGGITVTSKNGETITKVVISCTYGPDLVNDGTTSVSSGTKKITNEGLTITVTGVNASTFTFTCSDDGAQFGQFVVYYTEAPAGPAESIDLTTTDNLTWTLASMPAYDVELEVEYYDEVTLTDGGAISALETYKGQEMWVNYTRSFTAGTTSTVCLPFAYKKKEGDGSFYAFTNIKKEGNEYVATMTEPVSTTLTANTPYLYMPNADGDFDFSGTYTIPSTLTAGETKSNGWTFKGTYTAHTWTPAPTGIYGFSAQTADGISQGQFVKAGTNVSIQPMRCYLEYKSGSEDYAGARGIKRAEQLPETIKVRLVSASGEVTAIGSLQTKTGEVTLDGDAWYSLDGRRLEGKPATKGVYINNNNKVIIK